MAHDKMMPVKKKTGDESKNRTFGLLFYIEKRMQMELSRMPREYTLSSPLGPIGVSCLGSKILLPPRCSKGIIERCDKRARLICHFVSLFHLPIYILRRIYRLTVIFFHFSAAPSFPPSYSNTHQSNTTWRLQISLDLASLGESSAVMPACNSSTHHHLRYFSEPSLRSPQDMSTYNQSGWVPLD